MRDSNVLPYKVLIYDDEVGISAWGKLTAAELRNYEFEVIDVSEWDSALTAISENHVDIVIVDLDLNRPEDGLEFLKVLRAKKQAVPVILATGNNEYSNRPIRTYADALASGPVMFYLKNSSVELIDLVREASNRVDPVRRSLALMSASGMGNEEFRVDEQVYTVDDLLVSNEKTDSMMRGLREALQELVFEMSAGTHGGRKPK